MKQILAISLLLIISCTGSKRVTDKNKEFDKLSAEEIFRRIEAEQLDFERLNSNLTLDIKSSMFNGSVNAKIRMVHDSVIWLSASKLGFEVGRIMITPDSLFAIERLQKTYIKESIDGLADLAGVELGFDAIQDLLIGNPILHPSDNKLVFLPPLSIKVNPEFQEYKVEHTIGRENLKLVSTTIEDEKSKTYLNLSFDDYQALEEKQLFSYFRNIILDEENAVSIIWKNTELNTEKDIKFSIPSSYSPREL